MEPIGRRAPGGRGAAAALALASGALYWSAFPPLDLWPLAFVAWVPLLLAVRGRSGAGAFGLGWLQGMTIAAAAPGLFGATRTLAGGHGAAGAAAALLFCAFESLRPAAMCAALARSERLGWPLAAAFPVLHAAAEAFFPLPLPWYAAAQVSSVPALMQGAAWVGAIGVGACLAAVNAALAAAWLQARSGGGWRLGAGLAASSTALAAIAGAIAVRRVDSRIARAPSASIAVVQPAGDLTPAGRRSTLTTAVSWTEHLSGSSPPDLVVWPETVLPEAVEDVDLTRWWARRVTRDGAHRFDAPVLAGSLVRRATSGGERVTNSAVLFDSGGAARAIYDKRHPLAFGEAAPFEDRFPALWRWLPSRGRIAAGSSPGLLDVGGHAVTPLICYEDLVPDLADESVAQGSELLVTLTDDAWFGRSSAWELHLAMAKYRAIEHRRFLVRAANQAGSAVIDPAGRTIAAIAPYAPGAVRADVAWMSEGTVYEALRGAFRVLAALLAALAVSVGPALVRGSGAVETRLDSLGGQ